MITYCTNIHPGESWAETLGNLRSHVAAVASAVSPGVPFPVGLRLSNRAAHEIDSRASAEFAQWLTQTNAFIPTINGFPYGSFHTGVVKERVYLPDWRQQERVDYTRRLADLLDLWLPADTSGSISTVPVGFRSGIRDADLGAVRQNLTSVLEHLDGLRQRSGKLIVLALEPEPGCFLESTDDLIRFFDRMSIPAHLRPGLGICFDCCHHAIGFETPADSLERLAEAEIAIAKVQISSAPRFFNPSIEALRALCEQTYLHQVSIRTEQGSVVRYNDLPEAMADHLRWRDAEWRIHFHLPVFLENTSWGATTQPFIVDILPLLDRNTLLEIETYTWEVLPPDMKPENVTQSVIREIMWLKGKLP